jgi:hypothetical protein
MSALLCLLSAQIGAAAEEESVPAQPPLALRADAAAPPAPGLDLQTAPTTSNRPSVLKSWWLWTAVGVVAAGTVAVIVLSSRGSAPPPTDLGNQAFHP